MACIDKNCARKLLEKHKELFEKIASGKSSFEESLRKIVGRVYLILLIAKLGLIGSIWLFLASIDQIYGTLYLFLLSLVQAKKLLDSDFADVESNIAEAAAEVGINSACKLKETHKNDKEDSKRNSEESCKKESGEETTADTNQV